MTVHARHTVSLLLQELPEALLFLSLTTTLNDEVVALRAVAVGSLCTEVQLHQLLPMTASHILSLDSTIGRHSRARTTELSDLIIVSTCKCDVIGGDIEGHTSVNRPLRASLMGAQRRQRAWTRTSYTTLYRLG